METITKANVYALNWERQAQDMLMMARSALTSQGRANYYKKAIKYIELAAACEQKQAHEELVKA